MNINKETIKELLQLNGRKLLFTVGIILILLSASFHDQGLIWYPPVFIVGCFLTVLGAIMMLITFIFKEVKKLRGCTCKAKKETKKPEKKETE